MWIIRPEVFFRKKSVTSTISRSSEGWILVSPSGFTPCSAWCGGSPLKYPGLLNPTTTLIIPHMQDTLTRLWFHWQNTEPAKLPKQLQLSVERQLYIPAPHLQITDLVMDALKLVLEYVDLFGKYHVKVLANHLKGDVIAHIQFVANIDWQLQFPEPDFSISSATFNGLSSRRHRNALSLLMRVRGPYDGGIDYSTERLIKPAMDLLFDTPRYRFLRSDASSQYNTLD